MAREAICFTLAHVMEDILSNAETWRSPAVAQIVIPVILRIGDLQWIG